MLDEEQGASDNVLSLAIGDHPETRDWEDGKEYVFTEVRVRQQSPGQFMVISAEAQTPEQSAGEKPYGNEGNTEDGGGNAPQGTEEDDAMPGETGNPAIDRLMRKKRA